MKKPDFEAITSGEEFNTWYWSKDEMSDICKQLGLPYSGRKFDLRDRIMFALDNNGAVLPIADKQVKKSSFNWARADLNLQTKITDNVSFGPNFRRFMKKEIGDNFSCHGDFMEWIRSNEGKTLKEAIEKYHELEKRKEDPNFERKIADYNMFNQYTRDFLKDNPEMNIKSVRKYWMLKKQLPTKNGFVRYEKSDLNLE